GAAAADDREVMKREAAAARRRVPEIEREVGGRHRADTVAAMPLAQMMADERPQIVESIIEPLPGRQRGDLLLAEGVLSAVQKRDVIAKANRHGKILFGRRNGPGKAAPTGEDDNGGFCSVPARRRVRLLRVPAAIAGWPAANVTISDISVR